MKNSQYIFLQLLRVNNYNFPKSDIITQFLSDPDPEVAAMSNTLDFFGVTHLVANVPKDALTELPKYFICQLEKGQKTSLALVEKSGDKVKVHLNDQKHFSASIAQFQENWTGMIIAVEENPKPWSKERIQKLTLDALLVTCAVTLAIYTGFNTDSWQNGLYQFLSFSGLGLGILAFTEKNSTLTTSRFCGFSKHTDCGDVLRSKQSLIFNKLDLTDVAIVYFTFLSIFFFYEPSNGLFPLISTLSLLAVGYSLYSQLFIVKTICPICIGIASVLISQFLIKQPGLFNLRFEPLSIILPLILLTLSAIGWAKFKKLHKSSSERDFYALESLTFRRNSDLFVSYYNTLKQVSPLDGKIPRITLGTKEPAITITVVSNPLCKSCLEAHNTYSELLDKYQDHVQIQLLFLAPTANQNDPVTRVSAKLMQLYLEEDFAVFTEAFNQWSEDPNEQKWFNEWGICQDVGYTEILKRQAIWCLSNGIQQTPTFLINGKVLPTSYKPSDIDNFIAPLITQEANSKRTKEIMHDKTEALNVLK